MQGTPPSTFCIRLVSQMKEQRPREGKCLARGHTANTSEGQKLNLYGLPRVKAFTWALNGWNIGLYLALSELLGGSFRTREMKFSWEMPSPGQRSYLGPMAGWGAATPEQRETDAQPCLGRKLRAGARKAVGRVEAGAEEG